MIYQPRTIYAFETEQFEEMTDLTLCMKEPTPDVENPVLPTGNPGDPDESALCYTASVDRWRDGYGMWYQGQDRNGAISRCFASSADGLSWRRHGAVGEGLFNTIGNSFNVFNDGDRFLAPLTNLGTDSESHAAYPALRPEDVPDDRRRDMVKRSMEMKGRFGVVSYIGTATSEDGVRWSLPTPATRIPMMLEAPWIYRFQGRYIMNAQTHGAWLDPPVSGYRRVVFFTGSDPHHWELVPGYMKNTAHESILGMTHVGIVPIKCIDDRLLIGVGGRFDEGRELPETHFDITLLYSVDGVHWRPVVPSLERRSWVRRGRPGEWDFGGVTGMGLVESGDHAALYYSGTEVGNGSHSYPSYDPGRCQVGRALFVRDRFAFLQPAVGWNAIFEKAQAAGAAGAITTTPVTLDGSRGLTLNVEIPSNCGASVEVELLGHNGGVREKAVVTQGGVSAPVPLDRALPHEPVRIRLRLIGGAAPDRVPKLFAIEY